MPAFPFPSQSKYCISHDPSATDKAWHIPMLSWAQYISDSFNAIISVQLIIKSSRDHMFRKMLSRLMKTIPESSCQQSLELPLL